jgi:rhamnose utilization protein RhaD (predicted bifunctional aldolase and dehydrogenase)
MRGLIQMARLSHRLGGADYVRGGGGNSSFKDATTLWIKPSGIALWQVAPDNVVALDRQLLGALYAAATPTDSAAREAAVLSAMTAAVIDPRRGRPSVESPLHDSFDAAYVIHTHPALVNGMTCSVSGAEVCRRLFPDALWMDYTDPGYTLCMATRQALIGWASARGRQPQAVFMKNHGVFVAAESGREVEGAYALILERLRGEYRRAGVETGEIQPQGRADAATAEHLAVALHKAGWEGEGPALAGAGRFDPAAGPLTPDHIVYAKSFAYVGRADDAASLARFRRERGYWPQVVSTPSGVFGVGRTLRTARLALDLALDAATVIRLTGAFGGPQFMDDRARMFIENWEVESYRQKVMQ